VNRSALPVLFFDHDFPEAYADLVTGRANVVGPDDADLRAADAVVAGAKRPWNAAAFALGPRLRVISRVGVGYDNVVVADAASAGVVVCNTPMGPTVSTAEHTIALMLAVAKQLPALQDRSRAGLPGALVGTALELDGCTLGLIGLGRIAVRVAVAAQALGMVVVAHDPYLATSPVDGVRLVPLAELLATSDIVSLHAPAMTETRHLINAGTLASMKPGARLINCARGGLVDHDALLAALNTGHLAGAGLDVTEPEPLPVGHPLLQHPDVIVTPHVASATVAGRRRLYSQAIDNALAVLAGQPASVVQP
jgi:D-3-phosphoglycerate dehydrogenase / 2-oxoglutarate reductase